MGGANIGQVGTKLDEESVAYSMNPQQEMVDRIRDHYGLDDSRVLSAMKVVPRHRFVPKKYQYCAYDDRAISVGYKQTISQPYTVAFMTHLMDLEGDERVLEVGTGSGYQAAVLSLLCKEVYTAEIIKQLAKKAEKRLKKLDYKNVHAKHASAEDAWINKAPFDSIIITAGLAKVPGTFFDQLKVGGKLVAPVGSRNHQIMTRYKKRKKGDIKKEEYEAYVFVPFVKMAKPK